MVSQTIEASNSYLIHGNFASDSESSLAKKFEQPDLQESYYRRRLRQLKRVFQILTSNPIHQISEETMRRIMAFRLRGVVNNDPLDSFSNANPEIKSVVAGKVTTANIRLIMSAGPALKEENDFLEFVS